MAEDSGAGSPEAPIASSNATRTRTVVTKPIIYGNIARYFGKKREEDGRTHQWTVFVRPYHNEDIGAYVRKVQFKLHESYTNSLRVLTKPPFELTETGWGEFDMQIKLIFTDPLEKPLVINHLLKLFQNDSDIMTGKKNLVREIYDELVFVDPTSTFCRALQSARPLPSAHKHETDFGERIQASWNLISDVRNKTATEIIIMRDHLKQKKESLDAARKILDEIEHSTLTS